MKEDRILKILPGSIRQIFRREELEYAAGTASGWQGRQLWKAAR